MSSDPFHSADPPDFAGGDGISDGNAPPPKRRTWLWVLGIGSAVSLLGVIVCCGLVTFAFTKMGSVFFEPVRAELNGVAQVKESAGRVDKLTMNFTASTEEGQSNPGFVVLDAETANGPFQFSVKLGSEAQVEQGIMIHPDGTREELNLDESVGRTADTNEGDGGGEMDEGADVSKASDDPDPPPSD